MNLVKITPSIIFIKNIGEYNPLGYFHEVDLVFWYSYVGENNANPIIGP